MPSTTTGFRLPFPLGTDRLMDGDDQIRKLAQSVENMIQVAQVTIPITAANTPASVLWTYPVPFAVAPSAVVATLIATGPLSRGLVVTVTAVNPNNVTLNAQATSGTAGVNVFAMAIGPVVAVS